MATITHKGLKLTYDDQGTGKPTFVFKPDFITPLKDILLNRLKVRIC